MAGSGYEDNATTKEWFIRKILEEIERNVE